MNFESREYLLGIGKRSTIVLYYAKNYGVAELFAEILKYSQPSCIIPVLFVKPFCNKALRGNNAHDE